MSEDLYSSVRQMTFWTLPLVPFFIHVVLSFQMCVSLKVLAFPAVYLIVTGFSDIGLLHLLNLWQLLNMNYYLCSVIHFSLIKWFRNHGVVTIF